MARGSSRPDTQHDPNLDRFPRQKKPKRNFSMTTRPNLCPFSPPCRPPHGHQFAFARHAPLPHKQQANYFEVYAKYDVLTSPRLSAALVNQYVGRRPRQLLVHIPCSDFHCILSISYFAYQSILLLVHPRLFFSRLFVVGAAKQAVHSASPSSPAEHSAVIAKVEGAARSRRTLIFHPANNQQ